jgi:Homeodomain-like domain
MASRCSMQKTTTARSRARPGTPPTRCASPIPRPGKFVDVGAVAGDSTGVHHLVRAVAAVRFALSTRRDLLLEILAIRHQLRVLVRSNRRFRPSDRLLWLVLRRWWPQWRDALVLVQPATVDRWHRDGLHRCWRRRSRRPGRPRIDSDCRALIQRLAQENRLWGAPRIHGELLKLGIVVSERTVSRYLRGLPRAPSQTWRTFLANHLTQFTFMPLRYHRTRQQSMTSTTSSSSMCSA